MCRILFFTSLFLLGFWSLLYPASAQNLKLIQDTEIEERLHTFAAPILEIADLKSSSVKILSETSDRLSEGEILQLEKSIKKDISKETYFKMVSDKTASLFSAACELGCLTVSSDTVKRKALSFFGEKFGLAFFSL